MQLLMFLYIAFLFFVLTPGIVLSLPPKGSKVVVALTHAVVFALVYCLTHKAVYRFLYEGFEATPPAQKKAAEDKAKANKAKPGAARTTTTPPM